VIEFYSRPDGEPWRIDHETVLDALGKPAASQRWTQYGALGEKQFLGSINRHLVKSGNVTAIDLTGFTDAQKDVVRAYVDSLPEESQSQIIRIGF
jgi:hypothetical protein